MGCSGGVRDGMTGGCRKLHSEELHDWYCLLHVIGVMDFVGMRGVGHVARVGRRNTPRVVTGNLKERHYLEDQTIDGWVILKCVLERQDVRAWTGLIWLRIGKNGGLL